LLLHIRRFRRLGDDPQDFRERALRVCLGVAHPGDQAAQEGAHRLRVF